MKKSILFAAIFIIMFGFYKIPCASADTFDLNTALDVYRVQPIEYLVSPDKSMISFVGRANDEIGYESYAIYVVDVKNRDASEIIPLYKYAVGGENPILSISNSHLAVKEVKIRNGASLIPRFIRRVLGIDIFKSSLNIYSLTDKKEVKSIKINGQVGNASFSPDGQKLWYEQFSGDSVGPVKVSIFNLNSGRVKKASNVKCSFLNWFPDSISVLCAEPSSYEEYRSFYDFTNKLGRLNTESFKYEDLGFDGVDSILSAEWITPNKTILITPGNAASESYFYIFDIEKKKSIKLDVQRVYGSGDHVISKNGYVAFVGAPENLDANQNRANHIQVFNNEGVIVNEEALILPYTTGIALQAVTKNGDYVYSTNYCSSDVYAKTHERVERIYELIYRRKVDNSKNSIFQIKDSEDYCGGSMRISRNYFDDYTDTIVIMDENKINFYPID